LGLAAHDRLTFTLMPGGAVLMRAKNKSILNLKGMLTATPDTSVSIDEMRLGSA
jgi:hypothetical protein